MLIDYCHPSVGPKIKSDKVSFDGYEVANLISQDVGLKSKGFISDHFVKPPVNITVQFPCNICIYRVIIDPVIGQQQSCDIKLFTASYPGIDPWLTRQQGSKQERELKSDGLLFNFIGSSSQESPALTCYQNNSFRDRGIWNRDDFDNARSFPAYVELRGRKPSSLFNVSHLSVNILRSKGGKSVAIKRLEVWGMPSRNVPDAAQLMLRLAYQKAVGAMTTKTSAIENSSTTSKRDNSSKPVSDSTSENILHGDVEVPEDFVDQITFEIMAVPMLLPCGKNVDQSTLERFVNTEASWGRHPSDPFTGVLLGPGHQAVPNPALKARIDTFVLHNSEKLNVPRTLGKGDQKQDNFASSKITSVSNKHSDRSSVIHVPQSQQSYGVPCESKVDTCNIPRKRKSMHSFSDPFAEKDSILGPMTNAGKLWKRQKTILDTESMLHPLIYSEKDLGKCGILDISEYTCDKQPVIMPKNPVYGSDSWNGPSKIDHSRNLSNSLDSALLSTLTALPSFTKRPREEDKGNNSSRESNKGGYSSTADRACCSCSKEPETVVYKLPCQHIMCRSCTRKNPGYIDCAKCCKQYSNRDIVRVFKT